MPSHVQRHRKKGGGAMTTKLRVALVFGGRSGEHEAALTRAASRGRPEARVVLAEGSRRSRIVCNGRLEAR